MLTRPNSRSNQPCQKLNRIGTRSGLLAEAQGLSRLRLQRKPGSNSTSGHYWIGESPFFDFTFHCLTEIPNDGLNICRILHHEECGDSKLNMVIRDRDSWHRHIITVAHALRQRSRVRSGGVCHFGSVEEMRIWLLFGGR